jgi:hypothetical protein
MSEKHHICPVCGFDALKEPPYDQQSAPSYEICPCCGFEFGFDGTNNQIAFTDFRQRWIKNGARWFMPKLKPENWDLRKQLDNLT